MTENINGKERPLWSYREIKYDEFKLPRNTENVTTHMLPRKSNVADAQLNQKKKNLEELQQKDKKYFNNLKYQKVKVTKKVKNDNKMSAKDQKMILNKNIVFKIMKIIINLMKMIIIMPIMKNKIIIIKIIMNKIII